MKRALVIAVVLIGCKKDSQIGGVQKWNVDDTTLKDANGRCIPDDNGTGMYCFDNQPMGIKGMHVDIDLYFAGKDPTAKLSEIQLKAGACDDQALFAWMQSSFGAPTEDKGARKMWKNDHLWAVADLPLADDHMLCIVRLIPLREQARFAKVWP